jgi:hypothetical protein
MSTRGWIALWAAFLAVLAALMIPFDVESVAPLLLGGAALGTLALAAAAGAFRGPRTAPGPAWPSAAAAAGIALMVAGSEFGLWMLALGAGVLVLSLGALLTARRTG